MHVFDRRHATSYTYFWASFLLNEFCLNASSSIILYTVMHRNSDVIGQCFQSYAAHLRRMAVQCSSHTWTFTIIYSDPRWPSFPFPHRHKYNTLSYHLMWRACSKAAAVGVSEALYLMEMCPSADSNLAVTVLQFMVADLLPRQWNCLCINNVSQWKHCSSLVQSSFKDNVIQLAGLGERMS